MVAVLDVAREGFGIWASLNYPKHEEDQMRCLDTLAAWHVREANRGKNKDRRADLFAEVGVRQSVDV